MDATNSDDDELSDIVEVIGFLDPFGNFRTSDPQISDTDGDGLTDAFELLALGLTTNVTAADSDNNGVTDDLEDADGDTLTNIQEQAYGSDPLVEDTDGDTLTDPDEITRGTNPAARDTDNDALDDDSEVRLNTNPLVADSHTPGTLDGNLVYTSTKQYFGSSLGLSVTGTGDAVKRASVANVNYTHLIPDNVLVSNVSAITFGDNTTSAVVTIKYFPAQVGTPANLSMFVMNETSGSFDSMPFTLDSGNNALYSTVTGSGEYCVMDRNLWDARFAGGDAVVEQMAMMSMLSPVTVSCAVSKAAVKSSMVVTPNKTALASATSKTGDTTQTVKVEFIPNPELEKQYTPSKAAESQSKYVWGVDYGPNSSATIPDWAQSPRKIESKYTEITIDDKTKKKSSSTLKTSEILFAQMSGSGMWEAVNNGFFTNGLASWLPPQPESGSDPTRSYDVHLYTSDYMSSPQSLYLSIARPFSTSQQYGEYRVVHPDIDMYHASELTFQFHCIDAYKDSTVNKFKLEVLRKDQTTGAESILYEYPAPFSASATPNSWTSVSIPLNSIGSNFQQVIFRAYYTAHATAPPSAPASHATFLIDDVSILSTEEPREPTDAHLQFYIVDSYDHPITSGSVWVNYATGSVQHVIHGNGLTDPFDFTSTGRYTFDVYPPSGYDPIIGREFSVTAGQVETIKVTIGGGEPPTGSLFVHSTPTAANVYIDGSLKGQTPITVSGLSLGSHSIQVTKDGYSPYTDSIDVVTGTTDVSVTLTPVYGSIYATSFPYGTNVYVDGVYKGVTPVTIPNVAVGSREVKFTKSMYEDKTVYVSVFDGQTANVNVVMDAVDSDDDGISDYVEFDGYRDQYGNWHWSDITLVDSDADGNDDGVEAGMPFVTKDGHTIWKIAGDALKEDTDGDGASDYVEMTLFGTDPLTSVPTLAPELILHQTINLHTDNIHLKTYAKMGGVFGETGIKDGSMNWLVGNPVASSIPYFCGWMASGYFVAGDIRDTVETIYQGDGVGTALNAVAFAPAIGDAEKTVNTVRKVATKYPNKAQDLGIYLSKEVLDYVPNDYTKRQIWELCLSPKENEIINKLLSEGKTVDEILVWVKSEKGLIKEYLAKRIGDYNDNIHIAHKFSASRDTTLLGKWTGETDPASYQNIGDAIGANTYYAKSTLPESERWPMNQELLDLAMESDNKIKLCSDPVEAMSGADSTFKREIQYLLDNGWSYDSVYHIEVIDNIPRQIWNMVKV